MHREPGNVPPPEAPIRTIVRSPRRLAPTVLVARLLCVASLLLAGTVACSPRRVAERVVLGRGVIRSPDRAYGGERVSGTPVPLQRLDVYRPRRLDAPVPTIVFLYGGRWKFGEKRDYLLMANALARRGWVVVLPEYRKFPEVLFPAWVNDGAAAVRWAMDSVARYGGDASRLFVVGHSAGAHSVTLLALDEHYLRDAGVPAGVVRGFVSVAGPVDTTWTARDVQRLMGPAEGWPASYPLNHIDGTEPPLLLLHGQGDGVVTAANSTRLATRITARGGCARVITYPAVGHVGSALLLAFPVLGGASIARDVSAFVRDPVATACPGRTPVAATR